MGCIRSHKEAFLTAKKERLKDFFLFEDDIEFIDNFDRLCALCISDLPKDWDALWLGGLAVKDSYYSGYLRKLEKGSGGYAILFNSSCYDIMIGALSKEDELADITYTKQGLNIYKTFTNLVLHKDGYSTIQNKYVSYPQLNGTKG